MAKVTKVKSLGDLQFKARNSPTYRQLAMIASENLGHKPKDLDDAMNWLNMNASEGEGTEEGVVAEVNFCIPCLEEE